MAGGVDVSAYAEAVQRLADLEWFTYKKTEQSLIDDLFTGQHIEAVHCTACSRMTVDIQTFRILPVPIAEPQSIGFTKLEDCFSRLVTIEELNGHDGLQCECSNISLSKINNPGHDQTGQQYPNKGAPEASPAHQDSKPRQRLGQTVRRRPGLSESTFASPFIIQAKATDPRGHAETVHTSTILDSAGLPIQVTDGQRRSLLRQLPEFLIIQIMRFSHSGGTQIKLHQSVKLPLTGLDLTPFIIDTVMQRPDVTATSTTHRYDLYALCLHLGADVTALGHYIAYSQSQDGIWYRYDDAYVTAVNMDYELTTRPVCENAYLAFYRRTNFS